jgi:hypothetical protein
MLSRQDIVRASVALVRFARGAVLAGVVLVGASCGGSSPPPVTSTAAALQGPVDMHCTMNDMEIKQPIGMCVVVGGSTSALSAADDGGADAADGALEGSAGDGGNTTVGGSASDAGASDGGDGGSACGATADYGCTMYNAEGDDDDCKYHVSWKSTAVKENAGVTFYVTATRRADGQPATGADVQLEVYLNPYHPTPSLNIPNTESPGGNYKVGPVVFDAAGTWTVRFHFYEMCSDVPDDSPHGHAAFYVAVP